ncbi:MAG TPA: MaoC family dehydratase N-terminal domain-containing protein [Streptosporangiaceae bacterium]|jgi:acyl dehydratase|nr:MaoC family dehydratase N-terminal domain-containing protein [Streptosporangiaceae bacterium]
MAINRDYVGRVFPASEPYEVSRVKIAEFASAIGDANPVYRDKAAAQAAGHADVIAPPTFAIVISMAGSGAALADPGLGLNYAMVVHGEQRFEYSRPITAGDVVTARVTLTDIRDAGRNVMLTTSTEIATVGGEHVCTALSTIVERGA